MKSDRLKDKVIVITGGAGLMGRKHAEAVLEAGGIPLLLDIDANALQQAGEVLKEEYGTDVSVFKTDVGEDMQVKKTGAAILKQYPSIHGLVNNAAINPKMEDQSGKPWSRLEDYPMDLWDMELNVGLKGAFLCSRFFCAHMIKKGGVVVNIASDLGIIAPDQRIYEKDGLLPGEQPVKPVTYSVVKHGLIGLTKYLATYYAKDGIRCNALCPGGIYNNQPDDFVKKLTNLIPLGRMADADEYKQALVFLLSDDSAYMTGQSLVMDGGRSVW